MRKKKYQLEDYYYPIQNSLYLHHKNFMAGQLGELLIRS